MVQIAATLSTFLRRSTLLVGFLALAASWTVAAKPAAAEQRFVVRAAELRTLNGACLLVGCTVRYSLDGGIGQVFLVTTADGVDPQTFLALLLGQAGIVNGEVDHVVRTLAVTAGPAPAALYDRAVVDYYGSSAWNGYVSQPAAVQLRIADARSSFGLTGQGVTVAVIDTGVDPDHPALQLALTDGYDFTRNLPQGSERADVGSSTMPAAGETNPAYVNQSTMVILDQSTTTILGDPSLAAFGHGTMVAGVIHLVAPHALIMPLKAFKADGTGYSSDILRAIYYAAGNGAKVLNMSFSYPTPSAELTEAVDFATSKGLIAVGSAGNDGQRVAAYPAALPNVIGVASVDGGDVLSTFSNFGEEFYWIAAPGEGVVTTYPFGTYGAAWGTSFSAPFAAGTAALLAQVSPSISQSETSAAVGAAMPLAGVTAGRLDVLRAVTSRLQTPTYP